MCWAARERAGRRNIETNGQRNYERRDDRGPKEATGGRRIRAVGQTAGKQWEDIG